MARRRGEVNGGSGDSSILRHGGFARNSVGVCFPGFPRSWFDGIP
jgi:hypothetical protein